MPVLKRNTELKPTRIIMLSFIFIIVVGTFLLSMPVSSRGGEPAAITDALFTATSATCVTGLVVCDTATQWSIFGQSVILIMIQLGGLGLVTFAAFFNFALRRKMGLKSMQLASESINYDDFSNIKKLVITVFRTSLLCELVGMLALMTVFVPKYGAWGIYISLFLAISAFCNAGFDVLGFEGEFVSLSNYGDNPVVMVTIMALIICGGLGFVVWNDLFTYFKNHRLLLHTKVVLIASFVLIIVGALGIGFMEWDNAGTLGGMKASDKIWSVLFKSVSFRTAGFNTIDTSAMHDGSKLLASALMFIGVAPGSTGGGIKVTSFVVIIMTVISVIRNRHDTIIMKRRIEKEVVYKALAICVLAGLAVLITTCVIGIECDDVSTVDSIFETISAMSTTGFSVGVTAKAGIVSRAFLMITMFLGRVGPVSLAYSITAGFVDHKKNEIIPEGKIIVG